MSYRSAFLLLLCVFVLYASRILFRGEVIFPHDNAIEAGVVGAEVGNRQSNRKFSDESTLYIPELQNHLSHNRRAWLSTWNTNVELGRPTFQVSGLSRAYLITNILSAFTHNPFVLFTALALALTLLTGVFSILLLRSLGLHPAASLAAAMGLTFTTFMSYWLTFPMFLGAICWSVCLLWLITRCTERPSWALALGVAFATYSLLMTGYPQVAILYGYLICLFAIIRIAGMPAVHAEKVRAVLTILAGAAAGAIASTPVYFDLFLLAKDSARLSRVDDTFFLAVLPPCHNIGEAVSFLATVIDWSWMGNAIRPDYPVRFDGLSLTPAFASLLCLGFASKRRRSLLFWQLFLAACLVATIIPQVYLFAVHHLGFRFSRIQLLCGGIVPAFVLSGYAIDEILREERRPSLAKMILCVAPIVFLGCVAVLVWSRQPRPLDMAAVVITCAIACAVLAFVISRSVVLLQLIVLASVILFGQRLLLTRPEEAIHTSSPLITAIRQSTADGSRLAIADPGVGAFLPPNQEVLFGLRSINSYDSLSSRRYQDFVRKWSTHGTETYGRLFKSLSATTALADKNFPLSNISVLLSAQHLTDGNLSFATEVGGVRLYKTALPPVAALQTQRFESTGANEAVILSPPTQGALQVDTVELLDDYRKVKVTPIGQQSLLVLSHQYSRWWRALSSTRHLQTVAVDDFYQGVLLPPNVEEVELLFRPFVLWSWVPQALFVALGVLVAFRGVVDLRLRRRIATP